MTIPESAPQLKGLKVIIGVNLIACVLTILFWSLVYFRLFHGQEIGDPILRASSAATFGFLIGDLVWAAPLLALSVAGLRRNRMWGWLIAQLVNILWLYSMTVIWVRDLYADSISPGAVIFSPFPLIAVWATLYLWRHRKQFDPELSK